MIDVCPDIERDIMERLDLRWLVYLYMYQNPNATKASIAERFGIAPITLSRALTSDRKGVDEALVPVVVEMIKELRMVDLRKAMNQVEQLFSRQYRYEVDGKLKPVLLKYFDCDEDGWKADSFPFNYVLITRSEKKIYVYQLCGRSLNSTQYAHVFYEICRVAGKDPVCIICDTKQQFRACTQQSIYEILRNANTQHPVKILHFDVETGDIITDYNVYDPNNEFLREYRPSDNSEDFS